jgi:orotidine 5'-phosphate decarboxylase subfamily 2
MSGKSPESSRVNDTSAGAPTKPVAVTSPLLVLGIDPEGGQNLNHFKKVLSAHEAVLEADSTRASVRWLKPNLAFFLRHGSAGIGLLEEFVAKFGHRYFILLDAKFSEIENSLRGSLTFAFETLGVHGVTINPFLGEGSIRLALETCARARGAQGRVHVLCRTSESSSGALASLQQNWRTLVSTVAEQARVVASGQASLENLGGVVVGAAHRDILLSSELRASGLSVLAPGLGAQGAAFSIVKECVTQGPREILFPMSRGIFAGGANAPTQSAALLTEALTHFGHLPPFATLP